jgi:hypothetical protein
MCLKDFVESCEVVAVGSKNKKQPMYPFEVDTDFYKHPSAVPKGPKKQDATVSSGSQNA